MAMATTRRKALRVEAIEHGDKALWPLLGPFLCSRSVLKELAGPMYSAPGVTWFFAVDGSDVVGFCSMRRTDTVLWYDYAYVVPERRGQGVFGALATARDVVADEEAGDRPRKVAVPKRRWKHYNALGWTVDTERGSWVYGSKEPG